MNYAVIRSGGKQYKVSTGDVVELDKLNLEENKNVVFDDVLLLVQEGNTTIGKPNVSGAKVEAKLIEQKKGDKIRVSKFKAKSRYRKTIGFRAQLTVVQIEKINFSGKNSTGKVEKVVKSAPKPTKK